jgi:hypothetical protein
MATKTTGVLLAPHPPDGSVTLRIDLRNYGSRSHQMQVTVNRFLHVGRKSRVLRREITVNPGAVNFFQIEQLQGAAVEVLVQGSQSVRPSVALIHEKRHSNYSVLLQIPPGMFSTL